MVKIIVFNKLTKQVVVIINTGFCGCKPHKIS